MPRKRKANIARIQNLQGGGDSTSSSKRQKSTGAESDSNEEMASDDDDVVRLKSNKSCIDFNMEQYTDGD